jgi:predicted house-cleaning noncanonical NTP pyrophosphatase (MazG superfamily)
MPRINPARLTEFLEKLLAEVEEAYELSKNNDLTDILERVRGKITILLLTLSNL